MDEGIGAEIPPTRGCGNGTPLHQRCAMSTCRRQSLPQRAVSRHSASTNMSRALATLTKIGHFRLPGSSGAFSLATRISKISACTAL